MALFHGSRGISKQHIVNKKKPALSEQFVLLDFLSEHISFFFTCRKNTTKSKPKFLHNTADRNLSFSEMNEEVGMIFNISIIRGVWCLRQETSPSSFRCGGQGETANGIWAPEW